MTIGVVLAAGLSTRTSVVKPGQKAAFKVRWNGEVKPMVVHQVDALQTFLDRVIVVVGFEAHKVAPLVLGRKGVHLLEDRLIRGQGWVWKQVAHVLYCYMPSEKWFLSVNVDDLHDADELKKVANGGCALSVKKFVDIDGRYTRYEVKKGKIVKIYDDARGSGWHGTGVYMLNVGDVIRCKNPTLGVNLEAKEYKGDDVVRGLLADGVEIRAVKVKSWHDAGNPEGLRKVLAE